MDRFPTTRTNTMRDLLTTIMHRLLDIVPYWVMLGLVNIIGGLAMGCMIYLLGIVLHRDVPPIIIIFGGIIGLISGIILVIRR